METINSLISNAILSTVVAVITYLVAFYQWRKDIKLKLSNVYDLAAVELIKERISPYSEFMSQLKVMSSSNEEEITAHPEMVRELMNALQSAIYGKVGVLASYDTREFIVAARQGCKLFLEGKIEYVDLLKQFWAIHVSLKSDLAIIQPNWHTEIERARSENIARHEQDIERLTRMAPHIYHGLRFKQAEKK
jgi:hypothetical protein